VTSLTKKVSKVVPKGRKKVEITTRLAISASNEIAVIVDSF
jgi:hypothetical protein